MTVSASIPASAPAPAPALTPEALAAMPRKELVAHLEALDPGQYEELSSLMLETPAQPWVPNEGPQSLAYYSEADLLLFGGAAGGGKSDLALGLALTRHHRSIIFRVENTNNRGLIDRLQQLLGTLQGFKSQPPRWRVPPQLSPSDHPDQLIEFGSVPNPGDEQNHQGIPHDLIVFDEAAQFPEHVVRYLFTWNRPTVADQRCRIVLTSNPPTPSNTGKSRSTGLWLIKMFAPWLDPHYKDPFDLGRPKSGELRWYATYDGREHEVRNSEPFMHTDKESGVTRLIQPKSRTFIQSKVTDNPFLMNDSTYMATLQALPEELRRAMLDGDFGVTLADRPMQLFPVEWLRAAVERWYDQQDRNPKPTSTPMSALAGDISRGGSDDTVIGRRHNGYVDELLVTPGSRVPDGPTAAGMMLAARRDRADLIIDANGVGASCYDHLSDQNIDGLFAYVGSKGTKRRDKSKKFEFPNLRSAAYWNLRELIDPSNPLSKEIAIPDDEDLLQELLEHTWEERGAKIHIIPKEKVKEQLGRSPDRADVLAMLFIFGPALDPGVIYKPKTPSYGYRRSASQTLGYSQTDWSQPLRRHR